MLERKPVLVCRRPALRFARSTHPARLKSSEGVSFGSTLGVEFPALRFAVRANGKYEAKKSDHEANIFRQFSVSPTRSDF